MAAKLSDAPGCIGSFVVRQADHPVCRACRFRTACGKMAEVARTRLHAEIGTAPCGNLVQRKSTPRQVVKPQLSIKGGLLVRKLMAQGLDRQKIITMTRAANLNVEPSFAATALSGLTQQAMSKAQLRTLLQSRHGWCSNTAQSHVSIFVDAMTHLKVVRDDGGTITLESA